ncbi:MAG: RDD family protein [Planctomycetota bacterium]
MFSRGPVSPGDIQALALVMVAICLMVLVFVVRPGQEREPFLPEGYALATPLRRCVGWCIDALPGVLLALAVWPELLGEPGTFFSTRGPGGPLPWGIAAAVLVVQGTVCEALFGRTLGKLAVGTRTITYEGERPTWWMAFSRNVVRGVCPPLAVLSAMNPSMVHPQSFQTLVVVRVGGA